MKKMSVSQVRARNITEIVSAIAEHNGISRAEIALRAGVSVMTVSNIMEILLRNKAVYETEQRTDTVGRNPTMVFFSRVKWMIVLNLSSRSMTAAYLTLGLEPIHDVKWEEKPDQTYQQNLTGFLAKLKKITDTLQLDMDDCLGVSVTLPATYLPESDTTDGHGIPELANIRLKDTISKYFDTTILAATDVKLAAIACSAAMPEYNSRMLFYMYFGYVINGAIMNEGDVVLGTEGYAGSAGEMLTTDGKCLEIAAREIHEELQRIAKEKKLNADSMWEDPDARPLLDRYVDMLGAAIYNVCCLVSPYAVVLEGGCFRYGDRLTSELREYVHSRLNPTSRHMPDLLVIKGRVSNAVTGAAIRLRDKWIKELS